MKMFDKPLRVDFTQGGIYYLAIYNTYHERNKAVLAKSLPALHLTLDRIFAEKDFDSETLFKYNKIIEIVAPNASMQRAAEKNAIKNALENFKDYCAQRVYSAFKKEKTLPAPFKWCENYQYVPFNEDSSQKFDWYEEQHVECKNCHSKIVIEDSDIDFFQKYYEKYYYSEVNKTEVDHTTGLSQAREVTDKEKKKLKILEKEFGNHRSGLIISKWSRPANNEIAFYFLEKDSFELPSFEERLKKIAEEESILKEKRKEEFLRERAVAEKAAKEIIFKIFGK
jgi:hypothetical protein